MNKNLILVLLFLLSQLIFVKCSIADPAPVYDADAMLQQQIEEPPAEGQDLPPPPPPTQEGAYNSPSQSNQQNAPILPRPQSLSVEQRVRRVEQQVNNMQNSDSSTKVESLQGQVQALREQVEQLTHQLDELKKQQLATYDDFDKRLSEQALNSKRISNVYNNEPVKSASIAKPAAKSETKSEESITPPDQPNVAEEQQIYQTAYNYIKVKKYNEAISTLQTMLKKYPTGQFASNAHYWLGELFGLLGKHDQALGEFAAVVTNFPDSPRVSDAQLKVGLIYAAQLKWPDAKNAFRKVINKYPGTASARLAKEQLRQIKDAGH